MSSTVMTASLASEECAGLIVKNTFFCLGNQTPTRHRRSASLPPYLREIDTEIESKDEDVAGADDSTDACTDGGVSEEDTACSEAGRSRTETDACASLDSLTLMPPPPPTTEPRAALSSKAAVWKPSAASAGRFLLEVASVVAAVQSLLLSGRFPLQTDAWEEGGGWTLALRVGPASLPFAERLLTRAKQALLRAAEHSTSVFVMGYQCLPFTPTPTGFAAMFGMMEDETRACWEAYGQGVCCRGTSCRWKHPAFLVPLNVVLQLEGADVPMMVLPMEAVPYFDEEAVEPCAWSGDEEAQY